MTDPKEMALQQVIGDYQDKIARLRADVAELVAALDKASVYLSDEINGAIDMACPHDPEGRPIREDMDMASRSMIADMGVLLATINSALAGAKEQG